MPQPNKGILNFGICRSHTKFSNLDEGELFVLLEQVQNHSYIELFVKYEDGCIALTCLGHTSAEIDEHTLVCRVLSNTLARVWNNDVSVH